MFFTYPIRSNSSLSFQTSSLSISSPAKTYDQKSNPLFLTLSAESPHKIDESSEVFPDIPLEKPGYYAGIFYGQAAQFIGSNERRIGYGTFFQYGENFPFLRFRKYPGEFIFEASLDYSRGNGYRNYPPNSRVDISILPMARWRGRPKNGKCLFIDLGFGFFFSDPTADVNSFISTQPTMDVGIDFNPGAHEWLAGLRWRHASDGGTKGPNAGQNFIAFFVEYRY